MSSAPAEFSARTLPLDAFRLTDPQQGEIAAARRVLLGRCAERLGLTLPPHRRVPETGPVSRTERRYGISDSRLAGRSGYHLGTRDPRTVDGKDRWLDGVPPDVESVVFGEPVDGSTVRRNANRLYLGPRAVPEGGCVGEARSLLRETGHDPTDLVSRIDLQSWKGSRAGTEVATATRAWSTCMRQKGFSYPDPLAAGDDLRFQGPRPDALEVRTAVADVSCKDGTGVLETWYGQEVAVQRRLIRENAAELARIRAADLHSLALARRITAA